MNSPGRVLLIEDSESDVLAMQRYFARYGLTDCLDVAVDGEAAIRRLSAAKKPTLVLVDLNLPKIRGAEVIQWIRCQPALDRTRVCILSTAPPDQDRRSADERKEDEYWTKPDSLEEFDALMDRILTLLNQSAAAKRDDD